MDFTTRSYEKEILDRDDIPFADIMVTMRELNTVNRFLGGHNITRRGVNYLLNKPIAREIVIAEIGCGGGDNLSVVQRHLAGRQQPFSLIGIDIKPECVDFARQTRGETIKWLCSDYRHVQWPAARPDIIFSSLFCHHFDDGQMTEQLKWLKANSSIGFFINDLHRHPVAYYSISALTKVFSTSYLVKNDGPLSVRRAFKKRDWVRLLAAAGIKRYSISWHWAFRYLVCVPNEQ